MYAFQFNFFFFTRGVRTSLHAPQLIPDPLNILQAKWAYKTPGGDRRAQWGLNSGAEEGNKSFPPLGHNLKYTFQFNFILTGWCFETKNKINKVFKILFCFPAVEFIMW